MFKVAVAHSLEIDSAEAATDILNQCREELGDLQPQAGIIFMGIDHDFELVLKKILAVYPKMELIGGSSAGEISSVYGSAEDSIVLTVFCSDELDFKAGIAELLFEDTAANRINMVEKAVASAASKLIQEPTFGIAISPITMSLDPNHPPASIVDAVCDGFELSVGATFPVFGAVAPSPPIVGSLQRNKLTYDARQFYKSYTFTRAFPFLLISGPLLYSFGVESGWVPIGPKERVTKSDHHVIRKVGKDTAMQFFQRYLGENAGIINARDLLDFPLAVFEEEGDDFYLYPTQVLDEESGSLITPANVPEGSTVQLAHAASRESVLDAAERAIRASVDEYPGEEPAAVLSFSSFSRKLMLGTRVEEEYLLIKKSFPDIAVAGFYCYGIYTPLKRDRSIRYQSTLFVDIVMGVK